jgi:hypothetical protein
MTAFEPLIRALRLQGEICGTMGSPFNEALLEHVARDLEAGGPAGGLLSRWAETDLRTLFNQGAAIRVANTFNHLAMGGEAKALSQAWPRPGEPIDPDAAWAAAKAAIEPHFAALSSFLDHEPQTNEVRRSGGLLGGFLTVAVATGLPLRCFEVGASAGLNLHWDRFRYEMGPVTWGDPGASVLVDADWDGGPPPLVPVEVIERGGCDRRPTDLNDPAQRRRLLACIWPDMFGRLERSRRAIEVSLAAGVVVDAADALDWTRAKVRPRAGAATVLYHSVFWQYLPPQTQTGLSETIADIGASATEAAPFAWLRFEPSPQDMRVIEVWLTLWPGGIERRLAEAHPHGASTTWLAAT